MKIECQKCGAPIKHIQVTNQIGESIVDVTYVVEPCHICIAQTLATLEGMVTMGKALLK